MDCGPSHAALKGSKPRELDVNGQLWIERRLLGWPTPNQRTHVYFTKEADVWVQIEMTIGSQNEKDFVETFKESYKSMRAFEGLPTGEQ